MKFIARLILITLAAYLLPFYLPWWSAMLAAFFIGYLLHGGGFSAFNSGFLGGGIVWLGMSFKLDLDTASIMSEKIVQLFPFSDGNQLIVLAGLVGAITTGFSAQAGNSFRQIFIKKASKSFYS